MIFILRFLFADGPPPVCGDAADVNDDGALNLSDSVFGLAWLFSGGPPPPPPGGRVPGFDGTPDDPFVCDTDVTCVPEPIREALAMHAIHFVGNVAQSVRHVGVRESVAWLSLPGWNDGSFTFLDLLGCDGPQLYDEWCDGTTCFQLECNEPVPSWTTHIRLDGVPTTRDGWSFDSGSMTITWPGGPPDDLDFTLSLVATDPDGNDFTTDGFGSISGTLVSLHETFPELVPGSSSVLDLSVDIADQDHSSSALTGGFEVEGVQVAEWAWVGERLALVPVEPCE